MDNQYRLSAKEWVTSLFLYLGATACLSYLFYDSVLGFVILIPFYLLFLQYRKRKLYQKHKEELDREFLKSLQSMTSSLAAGFSPENAFVVTQKDMERMYGNQSLICRELMILNRQIAYKKSIKQALFEMAERTNNKNIADFAIVFSIAGISGGDFTKIISSCVTLMESANEAQEEARVLIRGKQYEQRIMSTIPVGIILYLKLSSGNFITILYHNPVGIIVMTICLVLYISSIVIADKIIRFEVEM